MVIGVTGNTGSGKSTFSRELAGHGGCLINVDRLAHTILETNSDVRDGLAAAFGSDIIVNGRIDRTAVAARAFADRSSLSKLNQIVWPPLLTLLDETIAVLKERSECAYIVADMAVLFESGAEDRFDKVITVVAPDHLRYQRLHRERGWSRDDFQRRNSLQLTQDDKAGRSHLTVSNDGTPAQLTEMSLDCYRNLFGLHF